ncbi:hypothetical protein Avbf_00212 [Armadillidium vulgare]|nr:hypothetical protein Avbf_00212 [Armadillidium vulgare]
MSRNSWKQSEFPASDNGPVSAVSLRSHSPLKTITSDPSIRSSNPAHGCEIPDTTPRNIKYATAPCSSKPEPPPKVKNPPPEKYKKTFIAMLRGKDYHKNVPPPTKRHSLESPIVSLEVPSLPKVPRSSPAISVSPSEYAHAPRPFAQPKRYHSHRHHQSINPSHLRRYQHHLLQQHSSNSPTPLQAQFARQLTQTQFFIAEPLQNSGVIQPHFLTPHYQPPNNFSKSQNSHKKRSGSNINRSESCKEKQHVRKQARENRKNSDPNIPTSKPG